MKNHITATRRRVSLPAPGYEGRRLVSEKTVEDPADRTRLRVAVNIGGDPIEMMHARRQIDEAQYMAAVRLRQLHESAGARGAGAIDYERAFVDGGRVWDGVPDVSLDAATKLADAKQRLGSYDFRLVLAVAGEGRSVREVSVSLYGGAKPDREYIGRRFRDALDALARIWGYSAA